MQVSLAIRAAAFGAALLGSAVLASAQDAAAPADGTTMPAMPDAAGAATDAAGAATDAATSAASDAANAAAAPAENAVKKVKKHVKKVVKPAAAAADGTATDAAGAAAAGTAAATAAPKKMAAAHKPAKGAAVAAEMWTGKANQVGDSKGYTVRLSLGPKSGQIDYPELACSGTLTKVGTKGDATFFSEQITTGAADKTNPHGCLSGTITVIKSADNAIWGWFGAYAGKPIVAYATLTRAAMATQ